MHNTPSIKVIGTALPENKISQDTHYSILEYANGMNRMERLLLRKIYQNSGIKTRHSVLAEFGKEDNEDNILFHPAGLVPPMPVSSRMTIYEKHAADLCIKAINQCLEQLSLFKLSQVTHVVTFSCTGMIAPGLDIQLVEKLGLDKSVERISINFMGCYAGILALKSAYHISRSQPDAVILVAGVELCTLHYQKSFSQDQLVANAIFADGAAAAIVSQQEITSGKPQLALENFYAEFEPAGKEDMVWRIGDHGFDLRLSSYVPELIEKGLPDLMNRLFSKTGLQQEDIAFYAMHPGGIKILEACEHALGITKEQNQFSYETLEHCGNMSSVTILFVLQRFLNSFSSSDLGKKILSCAFGPGLTMEAMIAHIQ